jgi:hypothetical protein
MTSKPERLARDHGQLDQLFYELCVAFQVGDVKQIYLGLDLFWARLAVHIRAEHLHLFPTILRAVSGQVDAPHKPSLAETESMIGTLCDDHNFFLHELSRAIKTMRILSAATDRHEHTSQKLEKVEASMLALAERLKIHNKLEEEGIHLWAKELLNEAEQSLLDSGLHQELEMPPRFA